MQIFIASDHRGYTLKNKIITFLNSIELNEKAPIKVIDLGPKSYVKTDDYNDSAISVSEAVLTAEKIAKKYASRDVYGILICGSAIGMSIQANRFRGIRAAVVNDIEIAELSRRDDDANVLCISADRINKAKDPLETESGLEDVFAIIEKFIFTPFSGEARYLRRIKRLDEEKKQWR